MKIKENKNKIITKMVTQEELVKIEAEITLYFKINYKNKQIALVVPDNLGFNYFSPLMKDSNVENHEKFIKTYSKGLEYCNKMLKNFGINK